MRSEREEGGAAGKVEGAGEGRGGGSKAHPLSAHHGTTGERAAGCICHVLQPPIPAVDTMDLVMLVEKVTTALHPSSHSESLRFRNVSHKVPEKA